MFQNGFNLVGKVIKIDVMRDSVRYILSEMGPIKVRCSAEIRDAELRAIVTSDRGVKIGDTLSLTGHVVFDEKTGANLCIVSKDGFSRIPTSAPAQAPAPQVAAAPAATGARPATAAAPARPAALAPGKPAAPVKSGLGSGSTVIAASDADADGVDGTSDTPTSIPIPQRTVQLIDPINNDIYDDDIPF